MNENVEGEPILQSCGNFRQKKKDEKEQNSAELKLSCNTVLFNI